MSFDLLLKFTKIRQLFKMSESENLDGEDEFYFESDHLALKENKDYRSLLKTILMLQVQRTQAIQDIDKIHEIQKTALEDPIGFVEKLNKGENLSIPPQLQLQELPQIDWSSYEHVMPKEGNRPFTRLKRVMTWDTPSVGSGDEGTSDDGSKLKIRGRQYDDSKPETFNQLWTPEEQKRLEELLNDFPPEEVEAHRWKKIADALGNRTSKQVQSRVQKYFKKLHQAGLPVPGRVPRLSLDAMKKLHRHQRNNHLLHRPSTFFPAFDPPVLMNDDLDDYDNDSSQGFTDNTNDAHSVAVTQNSELLALVIQEKEHADTHGEHIGFACDSCIEEPICGTRWHCEDCAVCQDSYDLCSDCLASQLLGETSAQTRCPAQHSVHHRFRAIRCPVRPHQSSSMWDPDYLAPSSSYNYLDPNFMPD